jgi:UDP-2,3-diacylglucosamine hydrolase
LLNDSPTLLISDLHLTPCRPHIAALFQRFLARGAGNAQTLYILGDLFDTWAGDDDLADPFNAEICAALANLAATGTKIFFMAGNRDILAADQFAAAARLTCIKDPTVVTLAGVPTLLMHGDTLCTGDTDYLAFRAAARSPAYQAAFLAKPLAERKALLASMRAQSEAAKQKKDEAIMDADADAIAAAFRQHPVTRIIHGHTHRQARHEHLVDDQKRERWVLGDWHEHGNALTIDRNGCRWLDIR